ncbi:MAG TPA: (d)CMP kinase [Candidatus Hydrogenedentes bacterium]|nr:(d)CMP kinase [Candidatus Hydrogenedentota bacterium]HPG66682.1 (d)CMP kinase [Candidatus Hydrogenedentota bacterium]
MTVDTPEIVAIDGPAGAGKSTVARRVAERLGFAYLDTGAMYRAATWWALHRGADLNDAEALVDAVRAMPLEMEEGERGMVVRVDGQDVTAAIRTPEVTRMICCLDQNPGVRAHLVELQRAMARRGPTVAEGRDMGTVVFPQAKCKVFLDASLDERARRRAAEMRARDAHVDADAVRRDIEERDRKNRERETSPLRQAPDATLVDTTDLTLEEVVERIVNLARGRA